jgi:membrane-associated phospholipid phosphatase
MPPLNAQDPLGVARAALQASALDLPMAALLVACEPWMLVLVALALYSWLEREVRGVLKAFAPAAAAILVAVAVALAARASGATPRPLDAGGFAPLLAGAFPAPHAAGVAALAVFSLLAYGRRAFVVLALGAICAVVRVRASAHWGVDLGAGGALGAAAAAAAYAGVLRLFPAGHLAGMRRRRLGRNDATKSGMPAPEAEPGARAS